MKILKNKASFQIMKKEGHLWCITSIRKFGGGDIDEKRQPPEYKDCLQQGK